MTLVITPYTPSIESVKPRSSSRHIGEKVSNKDAPDFDSSENEPQSLARAENGQSARVGRAFRAGRIAVDPRRDALEN
jgi:hypothetical protein